VKERRAGVPPTALARVTNVSHGDTKARRIFQPPCLGASVASSVTCNGYPLTAIRHGHGPRLRMNDLYAERRLLHDVAVIEHLHAVRAGVSRYRERQARDIDLRNRQPEPALTLRGTPTPRPSGASLDINVTVRVPAWVVSNDRDAVPPGPTMPVHVSVTGDVVVVVGVVGVSDPHADANTATAHKSAERKCLCIVSGGRTGWTR